MLCINPYVPRFGSVPYGCTQCGPCRINRRREWSSRMLLEAMKHGDSSFVTLTYADSTPQVVPCKVCKGSCKRCDCKVHSASLVRYDYRCFLKRLRSLLAPEKIRYFMVGEYGSQTQRPHFHAILFGLAPRIAGGVDGFSGIVRDAWPCGHVLVGDATVDSMQYVAGYVQKKMTAKEDKRLYGREPEFARMSLRPGIGAYAVADIAKVLGTDAGLQQLVDSGDVPASLSMGKRSIPLARYLRKKLRVAIGLDEKAPEGAQRLYEAKMSEVFKEALKQPKLLSRCISRSDLWGRVNMQRALNMSARCKVREPAQKI